MTLVNLPYFVFVYTLDFKLPSSICAIFIFTPFVTAFLYLLFSSLAHFPVKKALALSLGILLLAFGWFGLIQLLMNSYIALVGMGILAIAPPVILAVIAGVKKNIRLGWGSAALLFSFWSGAAILLVSTSSWDSGPLFFGCLPFAGICVFMICDLIHTVKTKRHNLLRQACSPQLRENHTA